MLTKVLADLARWPSFWPQVTQFRTWPKDHQDKHFEQDSWRLLDIVNAGVITRFSADLARWPSFWPQVTKFGTRPRNHQDKHFGQNSWRLPEQITPMLPSKFGVNWPFESGEKAKNRFSRLLPRRPSWISDRHDFSYFFIYKSPQCSLASLESIGLSVQKKRKIDFHGGHLGFPIGMSLAIFVLQVTPMLPSKFGVNWRFGSGEEAKNRFSRWPPSWISDQHDFSYF